MATKNPSRPVRRTPVKARTAVAEAAAKAAAAQTREEQVAQNDADFLTTLNIMLAGGGDKTMQVSPLKRRVEFRVAKMKDLPKLMNFFKEAMSALGEEQLHLVIKGIADLQNRFAAPGVDPVQEAMDEVAQEVALDEEEAQYGAVHRILGNANVLLLLATSLAELLPKFVSSFSDITEDEYGELDIDWGIRVTSAVLLLNYSFFTRSLLPAFIASIQMRQSKSEAPLKARKTAA